jgi:hypothetical protein
VGNIISEDIVSSDIGNSVARARRHSGVIAIRGAIEEVQRPVGECRLTDHEDDGLAVVEASIYVRSLGAHKGCIVTCGSCCFSLEK